MSLATTPREELLHAWWAFPMSLTLRTTDGEPLEVLDSGVHNRGPGPDFQNVRIRWRSQVWFGATELHIHSRDWFAHRHDTDAAYQQVILHVVLYHDENTPPLQRIDGQRIPVIELSSQLPENWQERYENSQALLKSYAQLPGRCGVLVKETGQERLQHILNAATEHRIQQKSEPWLEKLSNEDAEEVLFQALFSALGVPTWSRLFQEVAQQAPWSQLQPWLLQSPREARLQVLARWFGLCALLPETPPVEADLHREHAQWLQLWRELNAEPLTQAPTRRPSRPQSSPERLLVGWFHHLQRAAPTGLLRYWLQRLRKLELCAQEVRFKRELTEWTQLAFATPEWEPWRVQSSFRHTGQLKDAQLLGAERQNLLWINGVLPFFLAFARQRQEVALEQLLYRILMVLPPEPENRHTRFLRKRLFGLSAPEFALHSCGARQGLLQIARDYCHNFYQGCQQCELLDLLRP